MLDLETINVMELRDALFGDCFHGEVWVRCPYCGKAIELMSCRPLEKCGYFIIECECRNIFRDKK